VVLFFILLVGSSIDGNDDETGKSETNSDCQETSSGGSGHNQMEQIHSNHPGENVDEMNVSTS